MGLEINAARSAIYGRLAGDSQLGTYVGSRIYMVAAPEGTLGATGLAVRRLRAGRRIFRERFRAEGLEQPR